MLAKMTLGFFRVKTILSAKAFILRELEEFADDCGKFLASLLLIAYLNGGKFNRQPIFGQVGVTGHVDRHQSYTG